MIQKLRKCKIELEIKFVSLVALRKSCFLYFEKNSTQNVSNI